MNRSDLKVGAVYIVAGRGPMWLEELTSPGVHFVGHGGVSYWEASEYVVRECDFGMMARYEAQSNPRGVGCDDQNCWCRKMPGNVAPNRK